MAILSCFCQICYNFAAKFKLVQMTISSEIIKFATSRATPFTKKELLDYLKTETENVTAGTTNVLLTRLIETGKIIKVGRNLFSISDNIKPTYEYKPSDEEYEMATSLQKKFPFVILCVWKANAITPFMQHIPSTSFLLVDVERVAMNSVFLHLQTLYPEKMILLNPSKEDCERYLNMDNAVIVRPLIAEAPITAYQGINIPTIEKILVDIVADKEFEYANGAEMYHIYKNVFEAVDVNQKKMLRYASRRNKKQIIEQILTSNNV